MKAVRRRITLKTVASHVGLGRSTVSLILSGRGNELGISPKTQQRVIKASRELGYRPNSLASGLAGKRTRTIGLLVPASIFYPQNLLPQGISLRLFRKGYQTFLVDTLHDSDVILDSLAEMTSRRVDGVILSTPNHLLTPEVRLVLNEFPVTILMSHEPLPRESLRAHIICENIMTGVEETVDYCIRAGRRRPIMVSTHSPANQCRITAFQNTLKRHGLAVGDDTVFCAERPGSVTVDFVQYALDYFKSIRLEDCQFDALISTGDEGAAAAIQYLKQCGLRVPQDIAVVGTNNSPWTQAIEPPLASIAWRYVEACDQVVKRLQERLDNPDLEPGCDELPTEFIWRESAG